MSGALTFSGGYGFIWTVDLQMHIEFSPSNYCKLNFMAILRHIDRAHDLKLGQKLTAKPTWHIIRGAFFVWCAPIVSWQRIMCSQVRMLKFLKPSREMSWIRVFEEKKRLFLTSLKQTCNGYLIKFSENQSAPKLENRKTSPCSPCAPNLLHVSRTIGYHNLCSPV